MIRDFARGLFKQNPVFIILIGVCPALAVTARFVNALALGACVMAVLLGAGVVVSLLRNFIPAKFRVPAVLLVVTALVTITDVLLKAWAPGLSAGLGMYVPLVAVNCLILGRAGSFAFTNRPGSTALDALGMGAGFTLALSLIALVREVVGSGTITLPPLPGIRDGIVPVPGLAEAPVAAIATPLGAFLIVGFLMGLVNAIGAARNRMKAARRPDGEAQAKVDEERGGGTPS